MAEIRTREQWEREFDVLAKEGSFTASLARSRRPNSAAPHEHDVNVARARRWMPTIVSALLRSTKRLASPNG